jgi:adenine-specific DNA-methyltransferase
MLAAAMCKQEGFTYKPDSEVFWKQGYSYENDFIFTTTNLITPEYIDGIYNEMKQDESLLICCKAYQACCDGRYSNINIKKIPQMLFGRCEFGKDNYNLNIVELPDLEDIDEEGLEDE